MVLCFAIFFGSITPHSLWSRPADYSTSSGTCAHCYWISVICLQWHKLTDKSLPSTPLCIGQCFCPKAHCPWAHKICLEIFYRYLTNLYHVSVSQYNTYIVFISLSQVCRCLTAVRSRSLLSVEDSSNFQTQASNWFREIFMLEQFSESDHTPYREHSDHSPPYGPLSYYEHVYTQFSGYLNFTTFREACSVTETEVSSNSSVSSVAWFVCLLIINQCVIFYCISVILITCTVPWKLKIWVRV